MCLSAFLLGIQDSGLRQFEGHVGVLKNQALEIGSVRVVPRTFPGDLFFYCCLSVVCMIVVCMFVAYIVVECIVECMVVVCIFALHSKAL